MNITLSTKTSRDGNKIWYYFEWGRTGGQRRASGIFTYARPKDQLQKNHNKEALAILETKKAQMILDGQAVGSSYIPQHKIKANFFDYYGNYVKENRTAGNRHLETSLTAFKAFVKKHFISATDITENLCKGFRDHLVKRFNGETPANYFMRFKRVLRAAKKDGYFRESPAEDIPAKTNKNRQVKEILTEQEYEALMNATCTNYEVKKAFVFSLYTGLRWGDVKPLKWENIKPHSIVLNQKKTGEPLEVPLHEIAGLQYISAGLERLILFLYPTFVVLINTVIFKEKINRVQKIALLLTYTGIAIAYLGELRIDISPNFFKGSILVFLCAITYACYISGSGKIIPIIGATKFTAYAMLAATAGVFLHFMVTGTITTLNAGTGLWWYGILLAVVATVTPSLLISGGMKRIGSNNVAIVSGIGPVSTIVQAHFFLGERILVEQIAGTVLVIIGVLLISYKRTNK